jgi:hypothetical protein
MGAGVLTTISDASSTLAELRADDIRSLTNSELHAALRAVDALRQRTLALEVDTLTEIDAKALVLAGRALASMPLVAEAFHAGEVTVGQLQLLARCQATSPEAFERDEAILV